MSPWNVLYQCRLLTVSKFADEGDLEGDHQRGQEDDEQGPPEREAQEGEGVRGQDGGDQLAAHDDHRLDDGVAQVDVEVALVPCRRVGAPDRVHREEGRRLGDELACGEQRVDDRDVDGEDDEQGAEREQEVAEDQPDPTAGLTRCGRSIGRGSRTGGTGHIGRIGRIGRGSRGSMLRHPGDVNGHTAPSARGTGAGAA